MTVNWPQGLVDELAARRCVIFLGAGASANTDRSDDWAPPTWKNFLNGVAQGASIEVQSLAKKLIDDNQYLDAAEVLKNHLGEDFQKEVASAFGGQRDKTTRVHEFVWDLDQRMVVTTNFDTLYEQAVKMRAGNDVNFEAVTYRDSGWSDRIRSNTRTLFKAHGTVDDQESIVLTRSDFFRARKEYPEFLGVLSALSITHTFFFIGASLLSDPNVSLFMESGYRVSPGSKPHYALMPEFAHAAMKQATEESFNLKVIEYSEGEHSLLRGAFARLLGDVEDARVNGV